MIGNDNTDVESTVNQFVSDYNALISAMNTQEGDNSSGNPEPLFGSPTLTLLQQQILGAVNAANPNGSLTSIPDTAGPRCPARCRSLWAATRRRPLRCTSSDNTLSGLAGAINAAQLGVTASVVTSDGQSTLSLISTKAGASGALTVTSSVVASTPTALSYTDTGGYASSTADVGTLTAIADANDVLSGSVSIAVGSGTAQTVTLGTSGNTLSGLASAINSAGLGVTAAVVTSDGESSLQLTSATVGSAGALTRDLQHSGYHQHQLRQA